MEAIEESTTEKGTNFEKEVLTLFDLMGYKVEHDVTIGNRQIDIYGKKYNPPSDIFKIAIECKDYAGKVDVKDIDSFFAKISQSLLERTIDRGFMISRSGFTNTAKEAAKRNGIVCQTYNDLLRSMANFDHYIDDLIDNFQKSVISKRYIEMEGSKVDMRIPIEIKSMEQYIKEWVRNGRTNHVSILGEYGSGKTTLCQKIAHDLALVYKQDPISNRIPILINLRDYSKAMNLKQLITDLLVNTHRIQNMTNSIFMKMNEAGKLVLIFDGFDEMAQKVNMNITVRNFEELAQTAIPENSKVILTCRTEYFRSNREEREILSSSEGKYIDLKNRPNFEIIHLKPFSLEKIKKFLEKVDFENAEINLDRIKETYNLFELSQRPVLLDMIVKSIPKLTEVGCAINAGKLYQVYTDEWISRDIISGRTILSKEQKNDIVLKLAFKLYTEGKTHIHFTEIPSMILKEFGLDTRVEIDYYEHDLRTCTYLIRDDDGNYKFVHKSFMEYFIAKGITDAINKGIFENLRESLSIEILRFVANLIDEQGQNILWNKIELYRNKSDQDTSFVASNCISILNYSGFQLREKDLSGLSLVSCDFSGSDLYKTQFRRYNLSGANFTNAILVQANFENSDLTDCIFGEIGKIQRIISGPTNERFIYSTSTGLLKSYEIPSYTEIASIKAHDRAVTSAEFTRDMSRLVTGGLDSDSKAHLRTWKAYTLKQENDIELDSTITALACSSDLNRIAIGDITGRVYLYDFPSLNLLKTNKFHHGQVLSLHFDEKGEYLFSFGEDCVIGLFNAYKLQYLSSYKGFKDSQKIILVADELLCYKCPQSEDSRIHMTILTIKDGRIIQKDKKKGHSTDPCRIIDLKLINDNVILSVLNMHSFAVELFDGASLTLRKSLANKLYSITSIDITSDEKQILIGDINGSILSYDIDTGTLLKEITSNFSGKQMSIKGVRGLTSTARRFLLANGAIA